MFISVNNYNMEYRSKLSYILDFIFKSVSIFVISFIWIRFFEHNIFLIFLYTSIITTIIVAISTIRTIKNYKKNNISKLEFEKKQNAIYQLNFYSQPEVLKFFTSLFNANYEVTKKNDYLILKNEQEKIGVFVNFNFNYVDATYLKSILNKIKLNKLSKVYIFSNDFTKELKELCTSLNGIEVKCKTSEDAFKLMRENNIFPAEKVSKKLFKRKNAKQFFSSILNKGKSKVYFLTGLIFLISSIFMRYNIYYLVFTTIMFLLAMFSYFNKTFNKKDISN